MLSFLVVRNKLKTKPDNSLKDQCAILPLSPHSPSGRSRSPRTVIGRVNSQRRVDRRSSRALLVNGASPVHHVLPDTHVKTTVRLLILFSVSWQHWVLWQSGRWSWNMRNKGVYWLLGLLSFAGEDNMFFFSREPSVTRQTNMRI